MKKVIIVGAGIAGLSAGIYARQSGFDVTIYESHSIPGGACTSWQRKGYLFEGGMHWLTGSSPDTSFHKIWCELAALDDSVNIYNRDPFFTFEYDSKTACLYRDVDKLCGHLIEISPEDKKEIRKLCHDIKRFSKSDMPIFDVKGVKAKQKSSIPLSTIFKMLLLMPRMSYYTNQTSKEFSERFRSPLLRFFLENIVGPDYNANALLFTLATLTSGDGGYPEGGSLGMAKRMAKYFEKLGGTIKYRTEVNKISVENNIANGVIINNVLEKADAVIVTRDALSAIDTMFDTPIREGWANKMRKVTIPMLNTFICVGVEEDLSYIPENVTFSTDDALFCGGAPVSVIGLNNYARYEGYAPKGCTALTCAIMGDTYDYWKECKNNGTYESEKKKLAEGFIRILSKKYPKTEGRIAVWDVATPLTYERYLGSYKGSWMSVLGKGINMINYPLKPEKIKNLYFAGQRMMGSGGLPIAADTGRKAVQHLCKDFDTIFQGGI